MNPQLINQKCSHFLLSSLLFLTSLFCLLISVSGCSPYSESFDCPIGEGLKCASLSEVNRRVDEGVIADISDQKSAVRNRHVYWKSDLSRREEQPSSSFQKKRF